MRKLLLGLSILVMSSSAAALLHAQPMNDDYPLIISGFVDDNLREQALFQYQDNDWQPLLVEGFYDGSRSPDGKTIAYRSAPPFLQEMLDDGQDWLFSTSWDVSLFDLDDGSQHVIAA